MLCFKTFIFIDPYEILLKNEKGNSSLDVFCELTKLNFKTCLWYGFDSSEDRYRKKEIIFQSLKNNNLLDCIWWGDILFKNIDKMNVNPGIKGGCSIIIGNCSFLTIEKCIIAGKELEKIYKQSILIDNTSGEIQFQQINV